MHGAINTANGMRRFYISARRQAKAITKAERGFILKYERIMRGCAYIEAISFGIDKCLRHHK